MKNKSDNNPVQLPKKILSQLLEIGFTKYEEHILLSLYVLGESSAEELSQQANVPYARVYDTIQALEQKGLVDIISGRPRKFVAIEPKLAFQTYFTKKQEEYDEELNHLKGTINELLPELEMLYQKTYAKLELDELLQPFHSLAQMEQKTIEMIKRARKEILIFTKVFYWFDKVKPYLEQAITKGVKVRILMKQENKESQHILTQLNKMNAQVKTITPPTYMARGTLIDNKEVVFVIWAEEKEGHKRVYKPQYSQNPGVIYTFKNNFEYLWNPS